MSQESEFVDLTYRGLRVAHKAKLREEASAVFVEHEAPLPVGSHVTVVRGAGEREARVQSVIEQEAGAKSPPGMRLVWLDAGASGATAGVPEEITEGDATMSGAIGPDGVKKRSRRKKK
jgi:hypothetical protein